MSHFDFARDATVVWPTLRTVTFSTKFGTMSSCHHKTRHHIRFSLRTLYLKIQNSSSARRPLSFDYLVVPQIVLLTQISSPNCNFYPTTKFCVQGPTPRSLGCSSCYYTLVGQCLLVSERAQTKFDNMNKKRSGIGNWWQVIFVGAAVAGAYLSAMSTDSLGRSPGVAPWEAFLGGSLMLFGARMAGGCTSGHGISGLSALSLFSLVSVGAMFAAGIGFGFVMKAAGSEVTYF